MSTTIIFGTSQNNLWLFYFFGIFFQLVVWRYTNADLKNCQYLCLDMKIMCWRFHIKTPFTFWDIRKWDMWKVCLRTFRNNRICWKFANILRNLQTWRVNNLRILRIKNAKFSGYCFLYKHEHIVRFSNLH